MRNRKASLGTKDFGETVESVLAAGGPPERSRDELEKLDQYMRHGIARNRETMYTYHGNHLVAYQDLSRAAVKAALNRAEGSNVIREIIEVNERLTAKGPSVPGRLRDRIRKPYEDLLKCCCPILEHGYHLWYYDEDNRKRWGGLRVKMGADVPVFVVDVFMALVLSGLPDIGELANDLKEEYDFGMYLLDAILATMVSAEKAFDKILAEKEG